MVPSPPPFASVDYWNARFRSNPTAFDWLQPASILDAPLIAALLDCPIQKPGILHVGCGTSLLSYHLREHVETPGQIHNVDFSEEVIELGKKQERDIFKAPNREGEGQIKSKSEDNDTAIQNEDIAEANVTMKTHVDAGECDNKATPPSRSSSQTKSTSEITPRPFMRWDTANLLSLSSILSVCKTSSYYLIVDKSCSDSIACAEDVFISLPYPLTFLYPSPYAPSNLLTPIPIHPLHILALHLGLVTQPGGRWITFSYSNSRFPFLPSSPLDSEDLEDAIPDELLMHGFPDPAELWTLERKEAVEAPPEGGTEVVHRPKVSHWLYVLVRTERELRMQ
ncbi:hypothetical protein AOQ84DRAFT_180145 [Glonium stellatum]|uniref:Methyltransferase domain-containing protein n=1 Tax=Glonium stellatum TaxID=574774 RepID=A0A8E2EPY5_9PEZI|nr:hypothetical protein AOQ84DRAFT_180145 [Glonium stellatum]